MKLRTITYSESRETVDARGLKQWRKIGVEADVEEDEWQKVFQIAKKVVENWHNQSAPANYFEPETIPVIQNKER